ncbi:hypothetical protein HanIR_Chr02g0082581 [Helianthus annuus]|nr:hypothetical protein HanIR_Chr02g0082581 [Helianthus annuus]
MEMMMMIMMMMVVVVVVVEVEVVVVVVKVDGSRDGGGGRLWRRPVPVTLQQWEWSSFERGGFFCEDERGRFFVKMFEERVS